MQKQPILLSIEEARCALADERARVGGGSGLVCGIDEAGRGAWAGPVVAAAVILNERCVPAGIDDSKKLSVRRREALYGHLQHYAYIGVGIGGLDRIFRDNILQATLWAMGCSVDALIRDNKVSPSMALVDGKQLPELPCPAEAVIGGDRRVLSIAAASIVAKVYRDRLMTDLERLHPGYGWAKNKGYGTRYHREALHRLGVSAQHRRSFAPIKALLPAGVPAIPSDAEAGR